MSLKPEWLVQIQDKQVDGELADDECPANTVRRPLAGCFGNLFGFALRENR
jgi:hypothetical protein